MIKHNKRKLVVKKIQIGYTATGKFDSSCGEQWDNYIKWSGLHQVKEIVSLDGLLCPNVIKELIPEDWQHNLYETGMLFCFQTLAYITLRIGKDLANYNLLAVAKNPTIATNNINLKEFEFIGYDLIEKDGNISALTNCGGFSNTFNNNDLSEYGLITDYKTICHINKLLYKNNPGEPHAICDIWAIWRKQS